MRQFFMHQGEKMVNNTPQLIVDKDSSVSIQDLVERKDQGISVIRSAHVGNLSPYNLSLADAGIPILSVDHNVTGIDSNYMPEVVARQTRQRTVAAIGRLVCRSVVSCECVRNDQQAPRQFLDDLHIGAVRKAVPNAAIMTNTEYLRANESVVQEIVSLALKEFPCVFTRTSQPDGSTKKEPNAASLVNTLGIMQLNDDPRAEQEAVIMPNILDILANFVIESLESESDIQYHLSGPAMIKYIDGLLPELQALYARCKWSPSLGPRLPDTLTVKLVPTADARFATTATRKTKLDEVLQANQEAEAELLGLQAERKSFFSSPSSKNNGTRSSFLASVNEREKALDLKVAEKLSTIPEVLINPGTPGFITQYDLIEEGGLYVAPVNTTASMAELARLSLRLMGIQRRFQL